MANPWWLLVRWRFSVCLSQIDDFGLVVAGSMVFLCSVKFPIVGSAAVGFEVLSLATSNSEAVWFKNRQVHHTNAAEPTSFTTTLEHNASEPYVGEAAGLYSAISIRHNNQPILILINIIKFFKFPSKLFPLI